MRKLFLLILVILYSTSCYAAMDRVFSDWVYSEDTIILDNKEFYFKLGIDGNSVLLRSGDDYQILSLNDCKDFDEKRYICFNQSFYEMAGDPTNKAFINLFYKKPKLNITRTLDDNILLVGEEATYTTIIYNRGERDAENIYFLEDFPSNIILKIVSGCSHNGNDVFFKGSIARGSFKQCSYKISTTNPVDVTTSASVRYNNGFTDLINYSIGIRLYSTPVLSINSSFENSTIQINQKTNFNLNITNKGIDPIEINELIVKIPVSLNVTFAGISKIAEGTYRWDDTLYYNSTKGILFTVEGLKTGSSEILVNLDYEINEKKYTKSNYKDNIIVQDNGIGLDSSITSGQKFDANTPFTISIIGINKNNYTDLKNLKLQLNSTLFPSRTFELSTLGEQEKEKLGSVTITMPDITTTTTYKINANVTYETLYGGVGSVKLERSFVVEPVDKITILKTVSPNEIEEKKEATVKVQIRNDKNVDIENIFVKEIFTGNIIQRGTTSTRIEKLNKTETVTAYEYTVIGPDVINETSYNITTTVSYEEDGEEVSFSKGISFLVKPKKLKINVKKTVSDTEIYKGELVNVRYTIENTDEEAAKNIVLIFADNQNFDAINTYEYKLGILNPDEVIYVEEEQIRPKKQGDRLVIDSSLVAYEDLNGVKFNTSSTSLTLKVQDSYIEGPAILIQKNVDKHTMKTSDEFTVTLNISNVGNENVNTLIVDGDREWNETILTNQNKIITYKTRIYEDGEITLPKVYTYYYYLGNEYRAVSNIIKVKVESEKIEIVEEPEPIETIQEEPEEIIVEEEPQEESAGFFKWIWRLILNRFR